MTRVLACALAVLLLAASRASAASTCTITVTSVNFGPYDVFNASDTTSTGTISYRCTGSVNAIEITLAPGQSATFAPRVMKKAGELLPYNLFLNAALTSIWGDGTGGTQVYSSQNAPANKTVTVTIYGKIPAGADVSAGAYADTVAATINF